MHDSSTQCGFIRDRSFPMRTRESAVLSCYVRAVCTAHVLYFRETYFIGARTPIFGWLCRIRALMCVDTSGSDEEKRSRMTADGEVSELRSSHTLHHLERLHTLILSPPSCVNTNMSLTNLFRFLEAISVNTCLSSASIRPNNWYLAALGLCSEFVFKIL
jgi:hypothetical protein